MLSGYGCSVIVLNLLGALSLQDVGDHGSIQFPILCSSLYFFFFSLALLISVLPSIYTKTFKLPEQENGVDQLEFTFSLLPLEKGWKKMLFSIRIKIAKQNSL